MARTSCRRFEALAAFSASNLREGGLFIAHVGVAYLNKKLNLLDRHLEFQWAIASLWDGDSNIFHPLNVINKWKPIVVYSKGKPKALSSLARRDPSRRQRENTARLAATPCGI